MKKTLNFYKNNEQKIYNIISWGTLICSFIFLFIFLYKKMNFLLDSDMSSELVLSKLLAEEKGILSANWFYSTELRVINTQLIYAPLFLIMNNWLNVRILATLILTLLMLASYYYLCKQLGCKKYFAISSIFLVLPFSIPYFNYVLKGAYYIPHITITFLSLGLIFHYINNNNAKTKIALLIIFSILSLLAGMGGPRQLIILYLPLFFASIIWLFLNYKNKNIFNNKYFYFVKLSIIGLLSSGTGYLINSHLLTKFYHFQSWDDISYTLFNLQNFEQTINGFLTSFGFTEDTVFSPATISNIICFIILALTIISIVTGIKKQKNISQENQQLSLFLASAIIIFILLYSFTNLSYNLRYNLPIIILAFPLIMINIKESNIANNIKKIICIIIIGLLLIGSLITYQNLRKIDTSKDFREITEVLIDKGYKNGYATFWKSNILTELSDGKIEMYTIGEQNGEFPTDITHLFKWLQKTSHVTEKSDDKVFLILGISEIENHKWKEKLNEENIIYKTQNHVVYGYNSYKNMVDSLK